MMRLFDADQLFDAEKRGRIYFSLIRSDRGFQIYHEMVVLQQTRDARFFGVTRRLVEVRCHQKADIRDCYIRIAFMRLRSV